MLGRVASRSRERSFSTVWRVKPDWEAAYLVGYTHDSCRLTPQIACMSKKGHLAYNSEAGEEGALVAMTRLGMPTATVRDEKRTERESLPSLAGCNKVNDNMTMDYSHYF